MKELFYPTVSTSKSVSFKALIIFLCSLATIGIFYLHFERGGSVWIPGFLIFVVLERIVETFFTSQEQRKDHISGDWVLGAVILAYLTVGFGAFYEHYFRQPAFNSGPVIALGFITYLASLSVRWWAIVAAGDQWGIHSLEQPRVNHSRRLVRNGPYHFMRHPYYSCVCLEIISMPAILGSWWCLIGAVLLVCPLEVLRGHLEEGTLLSMFGWPYFKYQQERGAFLPIKKADNFDRRFKQQNLDFVDRRKTTND